LLLVIAGELWRSRVSSSCRLDPSHDRLAASSGAPRIPLACF